MHADGSVLPGTAEAPSPGEADRLLLRGRAQAARLRVHDQGQPGEASLQK